MDEREYDVAVIGSGVAGLYAALCAARDARVAVFTKRSLLDSTSCLAQGGVAAALGEDDSPELHAEDTLRAGHGLCRPTAVSALTSEASARIIDLIELGVPFSDAPSLEGGHSRRRVLHVNGSASGQEITRVLSERARENPRIALYEGEGALELWRSDERCLGVLTERRPVAARATILATGGVAALWERTTNPSSSIGEGMAMAYRAGAALADLEFVQFHPTALAGSSLLLTEALRGEGARLLDDEGRRFIDELAPRDVVARAVAARGTALLDLRPVDRSSFPGVMAALASAGYDPASEPIPVAAASHYTIGGVLTDLDGRTEVPGLYAAGECAATGVHGANRLASNSLLECLVFGRRAALAALEEPDLPPALPPRPEPEPPAPPAPREALWRYAGLVREAAGLERLRRSPHLLARLVAESALARTESRGVHFRTDFPTEDAGLAGHGVLRPGRDLVFESWN